LGREALAEEAAAEAGAGGGGCSARRGAEAGAEREREREVRGAERGGEMRVGAVDPCGLGRGAVLPRRFAGRAQPSSLAKLNLSFSTGHGRGPFFV
jgi:hypothetical protein